LLTITEAAASRIHEMMEAEEENKDDLFLRVAVKGGGCSGLSYGMGFDKEVNATDAKLSQHGINVLIDEDSAKILDGVQIDFKQSMMGGGFTIDNPNAIANCGCGSSFRTAENEGSPEEC
jgi:iron-sulfur cluster assembly protein